MRHAEPKTATPEPTRTQRPAPAPPPPPSRGPSASPIAIAPGPAGRALLALAARGGWWAGDQVIEALASWSPEDDQAYREDFRDSDGGAHHYEEARIGYVLGHIAGQNPTYWCKPFEEIDRILGAGSEGAGIDHARLLPYMRAGFERARYRWGRFLSPER